MRIGVAATAPLGADVLERLASAHDVAFLLTRPDRQQGRGRKVGAPPAKEVAERLGIEVRQPETLDESVELGDVDAMVVAAYGALIPEFLLERTLWLNVTRRCCLAGGEPRRSSARLWPVTRKPG